MISLRELFDFDPAVKEGPLGYERALRIVYHLSQSMHPIVEEQRAKINKGYLYGMQDMKDIQAMFKDSKKTGIKFWQLATMEKIRNVLIAEEENNGIGFELKAVDVTATNKRMRDMLLLQNRGWIDATMTAMNHQIGLPPYSMIKEKGLFSGNTDQFDKMGLDNSNLQDLNYFFAEHYRLLDEMVGEEPVNYVIQYNELDDMIPLLENDIIAVKAAACKVYVNDMTGAIDWKYVAPENVRAIRGKKRDFKDAPAIEYRESMSVADMIKLIGNDFDYERDMEELLRAVGTGAARPYTGIVSGDKLYYGTKDCTIDYGTFLNYQVSVGYIEWKEINGSAHKVSKSNKKGQFGLRPTSILGETSANSVYEKDVRYAETTYKAYYLSYSLYPRRLYKYGKLSYQMVEGSEDEYSSYSIMAIQDSGKSAVEVAMPWIEMIEKAVKKIDWMLIRAKPPGRLFNYESILDIAKTLFPGKTPSNQVDMTLKLFTEGSNELYTLPKVNGQPVGGGTQVNFDIPHGISASVKEFKEIYDWANANILSDLGISPMRAVYQPGERDNLGIQQGVNMNSEKATQYMHKMVVKLINNGGKRVLSYMLDIVQFKDINIVPYKFFVTAIGEATMDQLESMGKVGFHRFGIFVKGLNTTADKQQQKAILLQALTKGDIGYEQFLLISQIDSPKKAITVLAYEKLRKERVAAQAADQANQAASAMQDKIHSNKMAQILLEGKLGNERENIRGYWYDEGQKTAAAAAMAKEHIKLDAAPDLLQKEMEMDIQREDAAKQSPAPGEDSAGAPPEAAPTAQAA